MSTASTGRAREHRASPIGRVDDLVRANVSARSHDRFWSKVESSEPLGCWPWVGSLSTTGYGKFFVCKTDDRRTVLIGSHRWAWLVLRGELHGLVLDHLCRRRSCVNPWHLEPVTREVNVSRGISWNGSKTHCKRGHAFTLANTGRQNGGYRYCLTCKRAADLSRWAS